MIDIVLDPVPQTAALARLADFCRWDKARAEILGPPWPYMREKLLQAAAPIGALKAGLYAAAGRKLLAELKSGTPTAERFADYKTLFECALSRGDFADVAIHLSPDPPPDAAFLSQLLARLKAAPGIHEEALSPGDRSPSWEKLVAELTRRLDLEQLGALMRHRKPTPRKRAFVLKRLRANAAEYCTVMRFPASSGDPMSPFLLPRLEALVAACLRFLNKYR